MYAIHDNVEDRGSVPILCHSSGTRTYFILLMCCLIMCSVVLFCFVLFCVVLCCVALYHFLGTRTHFIYIDVDGGYYKFHVCSNNVFCSVLLCCAVYFSVVLCGVLLCNLVCSVAQYLVV